MSKTILAAIFGLLLLFWPLRPSLAQADDSQRQPGKPAPFLRLQVRHNRVSLAARDMPLAQMLSALATQTGLALQTPDAGLGARHSLHADGISLAEAFERLARLGGCSAKILDDHKTVRIARAADASPSATAQVAPDTTILAIIDQSARPAGQAKTGAAERPLFRPRQLLIRWRDEVLPSERQAVHQRLGSEARQWYGAARLEKIDLALGVSEDESIAQYMATGLVVFAEKNARRYRQETLPDDPGYPQQWGLGLVNLPKVWDYVRKNDETLIGVIDTGISRTQADLSPSLWRNQSELVGRAGVDDDGNGYIDDVAGYDFGDADPDPSPRHEHGTHVAGVIGAAGNNGQGVSGVLWGARLVDLKVSSDRDDSMDVSMIIEAIDYAVGLGQVRVVNCSFGGGAYSQAEHQAFLRLAQANILAVCSAGNSGWDSDLPGQENYPSGYEAGNIVSVTACDRRHRLASFANFGRRSVDVIAPGVDIVTTEAFGQGAALPLASGTSIAAPVLSGLAAILLAVAPDLDYDKLRSTLIRSAVPSPELAGKAASSGVLDAWLALRLAWPPADLNGDRQVTLADPLLGLSWLAGGRQGRPSPSWLAPDRGPGLARIITSLHAIAQINPMPRGAQP